MSGAVRVRVVTAAEAAARDAAAIAAGVPSRALMQRAGAAAAAEIALRYADRLADGVAVFAGPGNNGGDAWVVAGALAAAGIRVRLTEAAEVKTADGKAERDQICPITDVGPPDLSAGVAVDGLLGTGSTGEPRGAVAEQIATIERLRARGALVVALDVPSGVDATTGAHRQAVRADLTLTFGAVKRGLLVARALAGEIVVLDIGLGLHAHLDDAPLLVSEGWVTSQVPPLAADAHKGSRRRLAIVGGGAGMIGASVLAARAAARTGIGLTRLVVAGPSLGLVQSLAPEAIAAPWPASRDEAERDIGEWAHALLVGPGLGRSAETRALVERVLRTSPGMPTVIDADALNVFEGEPERLRELLGGRPAVVTPHVAEFGRLSGRTPQYVLDHRFDAGVELAERIGATVLLKGVPTVVSDPDGRRLVSAAGTPALAAGGSGDILGGIAATLLAQMERPLESAACAAWAHGRAAEIATGAGAARGLTLDEVLAALPAVWHPPRRIPRPPVLAELPRIVER